MLRFVFVSEIFFGLEVYFQKAKINRHSRPYVTPFIFMYFGVHYLTNTLFEFYVTQMVKKCKRRI